MPRLTDLLPLRSSAVWQQFADVRPIPLRIGRTTGACVPYSSDRRQWIWADHASQGVDSVTIADEPVDGWEASNATDSTGHPVTLIAFSDPVDLGVDVVATGRGLVGSAGLVENPADVVAELCRLAGVTVPDLTDLRAETAARSLRLAYSITERRTLQAELRDVATSIGGIYSAGLLGYVRLLPITDSPLVTIKASQISGGSVSRGQLKTRIVARYDFADGKPRASLEAVIPTADIDVLANVDLRCVADGRTALDVVARMLARNGVPAWTISATGIPGRLTVGEPVTVAGIDHTGTGVVLDVAWDPAANRSTASIELRVQTAGTVNLVRQGSAVAFDSYAGLTITRVGDDQVITLTYSDGAPIALARCILDGSVSRYSDGAGRVVFPTDLMSPGQHTILVIPPDTPDDQGLTVTVQV